MEGDQKKQKIEYELKDQLNRYHVVVKNELILQNYVRKWLKAERAIQQQLGSLDNVRVPLHFN